MNLRTQLTQTFKDVAKKTFGEDSGIAYDTPAFEVMVSDRPDLADYQSNAALSLAKNLKKNPREIAQNLQEKLQEAMKDEAEISIAGPGFINIKLSDERLASIAQALINDPQQGTLPRQTEGHIMMDFGGPNIAKELHVGHFRPHLIGMSLSNILRFQGEKVTSDIHFGDWGTPIGMIISQLQHEKPELSFFKPDAAVFDDFKLDIKELGDLYKRSKAHWDETDDFKEKARIATEVLQSGRHAGYRALWKHLRDISVADVAAIYDRLGIKFDLWLGESDVNDMLPPMIDDLMARGVAEKSRGAIIITADKLGLKNAPPMILQKSDGGYTYGATDLATIKDRVEDKGATSILYVVDNRQKQHFEQVFAAAKVSGYAKPETTLLHVGHGTINGPDGRPFKTRDGKTVKLQDVLDFAVEKSRADMPDVGEDGVTAEEITRISQQIGMGAIKFQELNNARNTDYIFDMDNFTSFEGKTGPYLQYAMVRCQSLNAKMAGQEATKPGKIKITNHFERELLLHLARFPETVEAARAKLEPNQIAVHTYKLAQLFSSFYTNAPIMAEKDETIRSSRLSCVEATHRQLKTGLDLLGIEEPTRMLRKETTFAKSLREKQLTQG